MDAEEDFPRSALVDLPPLGELRYRRKADTDKEPRTFKLTAPKPLGSSKTGATPVKGKLPSCDTIEAGSLLLGSVAMVTAHGLRIHLPAGMIGFVRAADAIDVPEGEHVRAEPLLVSCFRVGSHVVVSVLEAKKGFLSLSMKPSVINKGMRLDALTPGVLLPACLRSHEDHGTMLSFNIGENTELKGFVKHKGSNDHSQDQEAPLSREVNGNNSGPKRAKKTKKPISPRDLPLFSTVYVAIESVNLERNVAICKWAWESDIPVSVDCQLPLLCVRPGLLVAGEITDVHYPSSNLDGKQISRINYGFDIKCLNALGAVVPALHSVKSFCPSAQDNESKPSLEEQTATDDPEENSEDAENERTHKRKRTAIESLEQPTMDAPLGKEDQVVGRVIYVNHWQKSIYVSLLSHVVQWSGPNGKPRRLLPSEAKASAKVLRNVPGSGIIFSLSKQADKDSGKPIFDPNYLGYCEQSQLSDDFVGTTAKGKKSPALKLAMSFSTGSVHRAVELEFDCFLRLARLTTRESLVEETVVSPLQLHGGTSMKAEITKIANNGLNVRLSSLVHGKVPMEHLTDTPLPQVPDRYTVGGSLKVRVLRFDHIHNILVLTAKRILRKDPAPLLMFEQLSVGKEVLGCVSRLVHNDGSGDQGETGAGVTIRFYNDLQTTLDPTELKEAKRNSLALNNGDVVRSVVTRIDNKRRTFYVTLTPEKMSALKSMAAEKQKRRREIRREACRKAFKGYVSSRKRAKANA